MRDISSETPDDTTKCTCYDLTNLLVCFRRAAQQKGIGRQGVVLTTTTTTTTTTISSISIVSISINISVIMISINRFIISSATIMCVYTYSSFSHMDHWV